MAKRRPVSGFKTKSKKNKKSKKPKSKKGKVEREKRAEKIGLGLKDICTALTDLKVDASACDKANASYKNIPGQSKMKTSKRQFFEANFSPDGEKLNSTYVPNIDINLW